MKEKLHAGMFNAQSNKIKSRTHKGFIIKSFLIVIISLFIHGTLLAQTHVLKGAVKSNDGKPLPGAAINVKGTNRGVVADIDGKYIIEVNPADVLTVSSIGYIAVDETVGNQHTKDFELAPDTKQQEMNEVVVVGYGTQKKTTVTGAVSSVSMRDVERSSTPSISNTLAGRLPGIVTRQATGEPGYDQAQVFIRGLGTWVNRAPLVLIDGVERDMNAINAMEIESFSILKDASATAVYGVRGANGVIIITTKKGQIGRPKIVLRSEYAALTALRVPNYINAYEYASLMNEALRNVGQDDRWKPEELQKFKDGSDPYLYPNVNWTDEIMRKQTYQTINNLNISGGSDVIRYFANIGYTEQNGIWKTDPRIKYNTNANMKRYNFRSNVDINLSKSFIIELGLGGIIQHGNYPGTSADNLFNAMRRTPPLAFPKNNPDGSIGGVLAFLGSNPWGQSTQSGYTRNDRNTVQGTFGAKWDLSKLITKGLSLSGRFAYDHYYVGDQIRHRDFEVKQYLGKDPVTGKDKYQLHREAGTLSYGVNNGANKKTYYELKSDYSKAFDKHTIAAMALFNQSEYIDITAPNAIANLPSRSRGYAGRVTYDYDGRYLLEGNFGYNGSENFPKGQQYGFFPSASAGWIVSREKFWDENNIINFLKFRGSYGKVGNDRIGGRRFLFLTTVNTRDAQSYRFGDGMNFYSGIDEAQIGNPNVTWEVATKADIGVDLELFKKKVVIQADVFSEDRTGILIQRGTIPILTGFYPWVVPYGNLGHAKNKGIDAMVEAKNTTGYGLFYSFRSSFTYAVSEVIEADQPPQRYPYQNVKGKYIDQPMILQAIGFFKDEADIANSPKQTYQSIVRPGDLKYRDVNSDGKIDDFDRIYIGFPRTPQIIYGFGGTLAYKSFDFSVFFNGAARTSLFVDRETMYPFIDGLGSNNILREYYDNRWIPGTADNSAAKYPAVINGINQNNFRSNTFFMMDASFLRLKNAEIGYTLPKTLTDKAKINTLRFFINGLNLYTWDKVKVIDPESDYGTGRYPLQRSLNFGLQADFR